MSSVELRLLSTRDDPRSKLDCLLREAFISLDDLFKLDPFGFRLATGTETLRND